MGSNLAKARQSDGRDSQQDHLQRKKAGRRGKRCQTVIRITLDDVPSECGQPRLPRITAVEVEPQPSYQHVSTSDSGQEEAQTVSSPSRFHSGFPVKEESPSSGAGGETLLSPVGEIEIESGVSKVDNAYEGLQRLMYGEGEIETEELTQYEEPELTGETYQGPLSEMMPLPSDCPRQIRKWGKRHRHRHRRHHRLQDQLRQQDQSGYPRSRRHRRRKGRPRHGEQSSSAVTAFSELPSKLTPAKEYDISLPDTETTARQLWTGGGVGLLAGFMDNRFCEPFGLILGSSLLAVQVLDHEHLVYPLPWSQRRLQPSVASRKPPFKDRDAAEEMGSFFSSNAYLAAAFAGGYFGGYLLSDMAQL